MQAFYQLVGLLITLVLALVSGSVTGNLVHKKFLYVKVQSILLMSNLKIILLSKCCIVLGLILRLEFISDGSQSFSLFDDAPFWGLTDEGHDVRSSEHGSIAFKTSYGESQSCTKEARKYVKRQKFESLTFFE